MAISQRAMFIGADNIMSAWETFIKKFPYWALANDRGIMYQGDSSEREQMELKNMLHAAEDSNNTDLLEIHFYDKGTKKPVDKKTPFFANLVVRAALPDSRRVSGVPYQNAVGACPPEMVEALKGMVTTMQSINERLNDLEADTVEDAIEDDTIGKIERLLNGPIGGIISGFLNKGAMPNMAVSGVPGAVADIAQKRGDGSDYTSQKLSPEDNVRLQDILTRLCHHCWLVDDLGLLADMADNNPALFNMLLTQLRAQK